MKQFRLELENELITVMVFDDMAIITTQTSDTFSRHYVPVVKSNVDEKSKITVRQNGVEIKAHRIILG
ncbi:hypothetical protein ACWOBH_10735 [Globicatella sanguinis]